MNKMLRKVTSQILVAAIAFSVVTAPGLNAFATDGASSNSGNTWVSGDFHTHTNLSDGSYTAADVAKKAFESYGLDWYSAADHGGAKKGTRTDSGELRKTIMPRWESILGEGTDKIFANRKNYPDNFQFNGFEWNVPGHEHASVGIAIEDKKVAQALSAFDYMFDADKEAKNPIFEKFLGFTQANGNHDNAALAAGYLENEYKNTSYFLPNHPSRRLQYDIASLRDLNSAAPDVMFGFEGIPGHQKSPFRGGYAYVSYFDKTAGTVFSYSMEDRDGDGKKLFKTANDIVNQFVEDAKKANSAGTVPARDPETAIRAAVTVDSVKSQRTWGGADYMVAKVGGLWDSMLREGRHFWIFTNSDFHTDNGGEPDFWPGEYAKNRTFVKELSYQGILNGMRSGKTFAVTGELISALDYSVKNGKKTADMGETLKIGKNSESTMTIKFKVPTMNYNLDTTNNKPVVDHIDLIAGEMMDRVYPFDENPLFDVTNPNSGPAAVKNPEYSNAKASEGTVNILKTFTIADWGTPDGDGYYTITFKVPATEKSMYYRLRGTNLAKGVTGQTDMDGNPLCDQDFTSLSDSKTAIGGNDSKAAFSDIWFYSNPIFVEVK